jgi:hypothetical protein
MFGGQRRAALGIRVDSQKNINAALVDKTQNVKNTLINKQQHPKSLKSSLINPVVVDEKVSIQFVNSLISNV